VNEDRVEETPVEPSEPSGETPDVNPQIPQAEPEPLASDGLPDDAVRTPEEQGQVEPSSVDESYLQRLEEEADAVRNPTPAIQDPAPQPTLEDRLANIEAYLQSQYQQQQQQQEQQQQQDTSGTSGTAADVYNDPYGGRAAAEPAPAPSNAQLDEIQQALAQQQQWVSLLYEQNKTLSDRMEEQQQLQQREQQVAEFRNRYNVDTDTIDRATALAQNGKLLDAFTLMEGRSRAGQAGAAAREQRAQARDLAGTPTVPGNAQSSGTTNMAAAQAAYEAAKAMPVGQARDIAFIQLRQNYPEEARTLLEQSIGGPLLPPDPT